MFARITAIYRETRKEREHVWTKYATRPVAAAFVWALERTPITPNQVSMLSFLVGLAACAVLVLQRDYLGLLVGIGIYQLAYVLDCVDGMLARMRKTPSKIGHLLDFMLDEAKAKLFFAAIAVRLWLLHDDVLYLVVGLAGTCVISIALSLTTFTRRPEYPGNQPNPTQPTPAPKKRPVWAWPIVAAEWLSRQLINYPTYVVVLAIVDFIEGYFWVYVGIYVVYTARTALMVVLRLGRPGFTPGDAR